jgi:hypothetical protein
MRHRGQARDGVFASNANFEFCFSTRLVEINRYPASTRSNPFDADSEQSSTDTGILEFASIMKAMKT